MDNFPIILKPTNSHLFKNESYEYYKKIFREKIYHHLLVRKDETDYIDLENIVRTYTKLSLNELNNVILPILTELENLNWNTKLSFGGTGLFIYSTEEPPSNCW